MLKHALAKGVGPHVTLAQADAHRLPLADATFDWVVCASSFHYFRQPQVALREMRRVLRPEGRLVLVDWCDDYLTCKLCS
jgi:ubiquinone/menaquinone biosynthesis C-methylase UbiE